MPKFWYNFGFRYYRFLLTVKFCSVKYVLPVLLIIVLVIGFMDVFGIELYFAQSAILAAIFIYIAHLFLAPLPFWIKNVRLEAVLDKYGYSGEYLEAYEKAKILNKPFDLTDSAQFAQIYVEIGQSEKAVKYLNSVTLPEKPRRFEMVEYLRVYTLALLKTGELEKAEELWAKNSYYINRMKTIKNYSINVDFIFLTEIYIECYAAFKGDESRLQRAYELTSRFLNSDEFKGRTYANSFEIILIYELKALGKTEEFDRFYPVVLKKVDVHYDICDFARDIDLRNLEKAANGKLPFLD